MDKTTKNGMVVDYGGGMSLTNAPNLRHVAKADHESAIRRQEI